MKNSEAYYLGLDIGTDSIGYAVTDHHYALKKFGGEPMWGTTLFNAASTSADRRLYRTGRRRVDRRQQRMRLLEDLFAAEIVKIERTFSFAAKVVHCFGKTHCMVCSYSAVQAFRIQSIINAIPRSTT